MIMHIILLWILIHLAAPAWCYVLLGMSAFITILEWGINLGKK